MLPSTKKQRQLIGIACTQLGIDKVAKADMLLERFGHSSTCDIDKLQADDFLKELRGKGFKITRRSRRHPHRPNFQQAGVDKVAMLGKIEAYLAEAKRHWNYVHAIALQMHNVHRVEWCTAKQLHDIIAALEKDARRHGRRTG